MGTENTEETLDKKRELLKALLLKKKQASSQCFELISDKDKSLIPKDLIEDAYPLGVVQQGMMYHMISQRDVHMPPDYHNVACYWFRLGHEFSIDAFQRSIDKLVANEPILRTAFDLSNYSEPLQLVHKSATLTAGYHDLRGLSEAEQEKALEAFTETENFNTFEVSQPPLQRYTIHHLKDNLIVYTITEPHSISDGWSTHLTIIDLFKGYLAEVTGQKHQLQQLEASYKSYIKAEKQSVNSADTQAFWKQQLDNVQITELPTFDAEDPNVFDFGDHRELVVIPEATFVNLKAIAKRAKVGIKSVLLAAHVRMLSLLSGQLKVTTGLAFNGRLEVKHGEKVRGMFLNMLPVTVDVSDATWMELVVRAHAAEMAVIPHRFYPLGLLQNDFGEQSIFNTVMNHLHFYSIKQEGLLQDGEFEFVKVKDLSKTNYDYNPVFMSDSLDENKLSYIHDANLDRLSISQLKQFTQCYLNILEDLAHNPEASFNRQDFYSDDYRTRLLDTYNQTDAADNVATTLHALFEAQVVKSPCAVAVTCATTSTSLSYAELNGSANKLARALMAQGVAAKDFVLVAYDRSVEAITSYLALSKIGATYLPIESSMPAGRVEQIVESCQAKLALSHWFTHTDVNTVEVAHLLSEAHADSNLNNDIDPETPLYVLHTSGTTGKPKGVVVPQRGVCHYLQWAVKHYDISASDCMPLFTQLGFDLTVTSLFSCLTVGGSVRVYQSKEVGLSLADIVKDNQVTLVKLTPAHLSILKDLAIQQWQVDRLIVGGEQLTQHAAKTTTQLFSHPVRIFNEYGPTEASVGCICYEYQPSENDQGPVPIGLPIDHCKAYVLDDRGLPVPMGVKGHLYIAGAGLAKGYFNQEAETQAKFVANPFHGDLMYRTGDIVQRLHNGELEYLRRQDSQLSFKGFRIETGEVEFHVLRTAGVSQVLTDVITLEGATHFVSYLVPSDDALLSDSQAQQVLIANIQARLKKHLPNYMVPTHFQFLAVIPMNSNGKLDKNALQANTQFVTKKGRFVAPQNAIEQSLFSIWKKVLKKEKISVEDNFFDIGGNSILVFQLQSQISATTEFDIKIADLFEYPSIRRMANFLNKTSLASASDSQQTDAELTQRANEQHAQNSAEQNADIAVIGLAGRFTFAENIDEFWQQLLAGNTDVQTMAREDLLASGVTTAMLTDKDYVADVSIMPQRDMFDASFFSMTPREAELTDPQQRLLLETAVTALDDAGYGDQQADRNVGVYVGTGESAYFIKHLNTDAQLVREHNAQVQFGNSRDFSATRLSYKLNLRGPAYTVSSACSTGLVVVHQACEALQSQQCDIALAGGSKVGRLQAEGYRYQEGGILSPDGHCRAFDRDAAGTRAGEGVALVVLKRLVDAERDGDRIDAVIKSFALNNDGDEKIGFTAPSISGQVGVIKKALQQAKLQPSDIDFIETHGTGTKLGDQIELQALQQVFMSQRDSALPLGTLKSNIGHLDVAAGVASLIKTILVLKNRRVPPNANLSAPCEGLTDTLENNALLVSGAEHALATHKAAEQTCYAGVSSFGIGGTNAHIVLASYEPAVVEQNGVAEQQLLMLSANSEAALHTMQTELHSAMRRVFQAHPQTDNQHTEWLRDIAFTLSEGRTSRAYRSVAVASTLSDELQWHNAVAPANDITSPIVFVFPGQGSQMLGAGRLLAKQVPTFNAHLTLAINHIREAHQIDLTPFFEEQTHDAAQQQALNETNNAQLFVFALAWSYAKTLMDFGIRPDAMIGHSVGEYVAAVIADVMSFEDAAKILAFRGQLMQKMPAGRMVSLRANHAQVQALCTEFLAEVAAHNGPSSYVLSLDESACDALTRHLKAQALSFKVLATNKAFHSLAVEGISDQFAQFLQPFTFNVPIVPYASNVTGDVFDENAKIDAHYWVRHMRQTVNFAEGVAAIDTAFAEQTATFIEVGAGQSMTPLLRQNLAQSSALHTVLPISAHASREQEDVAAFLAGIGQLWSLGYVLNTRQLFNQSASKRVGLPSYPFERQRFWVEPKAPHTAKASDAGFYRPIWTATPLSVANDTVDSSTSLIDSSASCYVFSAESIHSNHLVSALHNMGFNAERIYVDVPSQETLQCLDGRALQADQYGRIRVLYPVQTNASEADVRAAFAFLKLLISNVHSTQFFDVTFVTERSMSVLGNETLNIYANALNAVANVARQECQQIQVRVVDFDTLGDNLVQLQAQLSDAFTQPLPLLAYRHQLRWQPEFKPVNAVPQVSSTQRFKTGGTYVLTGGLGNIGLTIAEHLATHYQANIILMGRNTLPDASEWPMYLRNVKPNTRTCRQINAILRMQAAGSEVKTYSLDMAESAHVERAFTLIAEQHSQIDGVIHCAGKVTNSHCLLAQTDDSYIDAHLAGKFTGMRNVDQHVNLVNPEFVLVMSSLSVVLGGFGFAAYSYANAVADAFVMNKRQAGDTRWFSIDWDGWSTHRSDDGIDAVEGMTAIEQGLANAQHPVLVYAQSELEQARDKWLQLDNFATSFLATQSLSTQASAQSVGQHGAVASPMLDGIEQILVKEWQRILGVDEIAVDDDFFVLGGDSLLVARVIGFVRQMFDVSADALNFKAFFANPTIRFLHQVIQVSTQEDALSYLSPDMALSEDEEYEEGEF